MLFRNKKHSTSDTRTAPTVMHHGQRVNSYYTASKKQITTFQRHAERNDSNKPTTTIVAFKRLGIVTTSILLFVLALMAMFTLSSSASISIEQGGAYRTPAEYDASVSAVLGKHFKNHVKLSLDSNAVEQAVKAALPEAQSVAVYAPLFGRSPEVIIATAKPFAVLLQSDGPTLLLTERGRLVIEAGKSTVDTAKLPTIANESKTAYKAGDQLFKPDEMTTLLELQYQYAKVGGVAATSYILPTTPREIHTREGDYIAKYSLNENANITQQFGALKAVQGQLLAQNKQPKEYIDVRLASKVFIK